ncbi:MAG: DUF2007 domain-containing protein [Chloroflexi bacterium]|nr:DUF2007 domain-containing protein [Chloroflexota bacterium]
MEHRGEQGSVRIAVFQGEPLARLAEQRLLAEGIPCVVRSQGVGPGGWGPAANLPYAIYVPRSNEDRARELLEVLPPDLPEAEGPRPLASRWPLLVLVILVVVAAAVILAVADAAFARLFR